MSKAKENEKVEVPKYDPEMLFGDYVNQCAAYVITLLPSRWQQYAEDYDTTSAISDTLFPECDYEDPDPRRPSINHITMAIMSLHEEFGLDLAHTSKITALFDGLRV
jgi:hypothetical protein